MPSKTYREDWKSRENIKKLSDAKPMLWKEIMKGDTEVVSFTKEFLSDEVISGDYKFIQRIFIRFLS